MAELLVGVLEQTKWKKNPSLYNVASKLFCKVVREKLDEPTKKELKPQINKIKKLFKQFKEKEMPEAYQSEKSDKKHHNGSSLKKLEAKNSKIKASDLKKIPKVQYAGRTLRSTTWAEFRDDGSIRKKGFSRSASLTSKRIFVMDRFGQFYMSKDISGSAKNGKKAIKHSSFLNGNPVAGAGEITCNKSGTTVKLTNESGHYQLDEPEMRQVLKALKRHGVNVDAIDVVIKNSQGTRTLKGSALIG